MFDSLKQLHKLFSRKAAKAPREASSCLKYKIVAELLHVVVKKIPDVGLRFLCDFAAWRENGFALALSFQRRLKSSLFCRSDVLSPFLRGIA
jgi:hypothetical protein